MTKTDDLQHFVAVADTGSFSGAATLLDVQVARVSRSVSRLEEQLQVTLFNRTTRRVELTQEGRIYLSHIREGLNMIALGEESLKQLHTTPSGLLRVDAASPFIFHQIAPHVGEFLSHYPNITLDITSHEGIIDLLEHRTDVAIRIGELQDSNLYYQTLGQSRLKLVASPDYLNEHPPITTIADLSAHKLIGFSGNTTLNRWPLKQNTTLSFSLFASSGETIRQLCLAGQGIALLSTFMCQKDITSGALTALLPEAIVSPNRRETVNAVYYKNSVVSSRVSVFLDFLKPRLTL